MSGSRSDSAVLARTAATGAVIALLVGACTRAHPDFPVEDAAAHEDAKRVLASWGAR